MQIYSRVRSKLKGPLFWIHDMSGLRLSEYRRRDCGKVKIPRFGRDFQARWESPKDFSTERLFHSLSPPVLLHLWQEGPSLRVVATHNVRPVSNAPTLIQMFADGHRTSSQRSPKTLRFAVSFLQSPPCCPDSPLVVVAPRTEHPDPSSGTVETRFPPAKPAPGIAG